MNKKIIPLHGNGIPTNLLEGEIGVRIKSDSESIWTKNSDGDIERVNLEHYSILNKEEYDALTEKRNDQLYFIIGAPTLVTIIFKDYDGRIISNKTYNQGETIVPPPSPQREGYDFIGWDGNIGKAMNDTTYTALYSLSHSLKITMLDFYNEVSLIPLSVEKINITEDVEWTTDLPNSIVIIDGLNLHFIQPYSGIITLTAKAEGYTDVKAISIICSSVPQSLDVSIDHIFMVYPQMREAIEEVVNNANTNLSVKDQLNIDDQIANFGRRTTYKDDQGWATTGGIINEDVKIILERDFPYFTNIKSITLQNGEKLDAPHFWAVVNASYHNNGDFGGWAGDLVQFAADIKNNPTEEINFPDKRFGYEDWISDADAYNIYKDYASDLYLGLTTYFTNSLTNKQRINSFMTDVDMYTRYTQSPNAALLFALEFVVEKVSKAQIKVAADKMQLYLDNNK